MKPRNRKAREKDYLSYPGLLPTSTSAWCRHRAIDRIVRNDMRIIMLRRLLQRHDDLNALMWGVGWITFNWAVVEQNFEMCISLIYHDLNGKTLVSSHLPLPWNQKVAFLEKAYKKIPEMVNYPEGLELVGEADALSSTRNDLVHGVLTKLKPVDRKWLFHIFDYDRADKKTNWHVLRHFNFGVPEFLSLEGKLVPLAGKVATFGSRLLKDLGP